MRTKSSRFLTLLLAFVVQITFAQEKTISGNVTDQDGLPLPGANVVVKGTGNGTQTDFDGNYTINASVGQTLVYSFIGQLSQERIIASNNFINVQLLEDTQALEEVVVTAQGIKREKKALGYAVTTIEAGALESKPETDVAKILTGKVAGVQVNTAGGFLGVTPNVIIRSKNSITGNNQPLYIVDGIPIAGDRSFDLDPNNIASTSVLKGLAASTLYGEDGRNGVILITTKTGSSTTRDKKFEVEVLQTTSLLAVANLPEYQNKYGQGADNGINTTFFGTWGAAFDGQTVPHHLSIDAYADSFPEFQGATVEYKAVPDNVSDFFNSELSTNTSVLISKNTEAASFSFNMSYADQKGFVESNNLKRLNLSFGGNVKLSNKLTLSAKADFSDTDSNRPSLATFQLLTWIPRNLDIHNLPYQDPNTGASVYYRTTITNPIWNVKNSGFGLFTDRFIGSANLKYDFTDKTSLTYTYGLDLYNERNLNFTHKGGIESPLGFMTSFDNYQKTQNHRLIFAFNSIDINDSFSMNGQLGFETKNTFRDVYGVTGTDQVVFGVLDLDNFREHSPVTRSVTLDGFAITPSVQNRIGLFGAVDFAYKNYLYLNLQARNDWASTVEKENQSIFYPSVALSFIPTSAFESMGANGNYLKFRASFGSSASFPLPYQTRPTLTSTANGWINPYDGSVVAFNSVDTFLPNPDLGPEFLKEYEVGTEGRFFDNKVSFDLSLYYKTVEDQILFSNLPNSAGYTLTQINAGDVHTKGIELGLTLTPIRTDNFSWSLNNNFTAYESTVWNLPVDLITIGSGTGGSGSVINTAINGEPFGVFRGTYAVKDDNGNLLIDPSTGKIIFSDNVGLDNDIIGDPNEDFRFTTINTISWKNLSLSAQLEYVHGGDIYSNTASNLLRRGVTVDTENREGSFIIPGVLGDPATGVALSDGNGDPIPNNIQIGANDLYFINLMDVDENLVYDASVIRLRDVTLSYSMPDKALEKTPFGSMTFTLSGNNLWYETPNIPKGLNLDPEVLATGQGNTFGVDFQNAPSYKQYSFSVKLTF